MSDKKLTPRVGDRVLVKFPHHTKSFIGDVIEQLAVDRYRIKVDGRGVVYVDRADLTVVDRVPVEWPEGWSWFGVGLAEVGGRSFSRREIERILATGPDMLARWDELMGDDA